MCNFFPPVSFSFNKGQAGEQHLQVTRGVKNTWKPYLSKSTDTLQWKLLHYNLQVTNSKTTWVKVLEYLILTVLKYFTYTKYRLKDALVKETSKSKTATLWRNWGKHAEARIYVKAFHGKTRTSNKTTITFNNLQQTKETLGLCVYIYLDVVFTTSRCLNGLSCCHVIGWLAIKQVSLIKWPVSAHTHTHTHTHTRLTSWTR